MTNINLSGNNPTNLCHYYNLSRPESFSERKNFNLYGETFPTLLRCMQMHWDKATQVTLTNSQISVYSHTPVMREFFQKYNFSLVFVHKNPNTGRMIYTLMAPPIGNSDESSAVRVTQEPNTYPVLPHSGSCCGMREIGGINNPSSEIRRKVDESELVPSHMRILPHSVLYASLQEGLHCKNGLAYQFTTSKTFDDESEYLMEMYLGFHCVFQWVSPITKETIRHWMRSLTKDNNHGRMI